MRESHPLFKICFLSIYKTLILNTGMSLNITIDRIYLSLPYIFLLQIE